MSTGHKSNSLKERLREKTEAEASQTEDSMKSQFQTFESNLMISLERAQNTIESAINEHTNSMNGTIIKYKHKRSLRPPAWLIASLIMGAISLSLWAMVLINKQAEASRYARMGIYWNHSKARPTVIIDPSMLNITNCTLSGRAYYCLKKKEE